MTWIVCNSVLLYLFTDLCPIERSKWCPISSITADWWSRMAACPDYTLHTMTPSHDWSHMEIHKAHAKERRKMKMYYLNCCLFQRKRKSDELSRQLEDSQRKRKATEQLIAKAKVGREASVSNRQFVCQLALMQCWSYLYYFSYLNDCSDVSRMYGCFC